MLANLHIENIAVVRRADIDLGEGAYRHNRRDRCGKVGAHRLDKTALGRACAA